MNQCDGCMQGAPLKDGRLHVDKDGKAFMGCQAHRYNEVKRDPTWYTEEDVYSEIGGGDGR